MWTEYLQASATHPFGAAFVQFAILGMLGEILANMVRRGSPAYPFTGAQTALKIPTWGLLGIYIKVMFLTAAAGVDALTHHGLMVGGFGTALLRSTLMNIMLGPSMMILHRLTDNAIDRWVGASPLGWTNLDKSIASLIWLWIPLHTITFLQAPEIRVGLAAVLSLVLGLVLGFFGRRSVPGPAR